MKMNDGSNYLRVDGTITLKLMFPKGTWYKDTNRIHLGFNMIQWHVIVDKEMKIRVHYQAAILRD
jgi:hypothetical protein